MSGLPRFLARTPRQILPSDVEDGEVEPAEALADLATDPAPASTRAPIPEIAGPREESLVDVARLLVARRGDALRIEGVSDPADPDRDIYESGSLLPGPHATLACPTFAAWLDTTS